MRSSDATQQRGAATKHVETEVVYNADFDRVIGGE
jgi:hypothetical protein